MSELDLPQLGRYRIIEPIGKGAMGTVYRAEDPSLGRVVALKAVHLAPGAAGSADYQARFYQEAKAAGGLNHPHIITIYDTGQEGEWAYIAMELLEGEELRDMMAAGRVPLRLALELAAQVAGALQAAHDAGVIHRDIKPGNIMVLRGSHAKLMDFGIARMRVSTVETQVGLVLGSPKYMSPEQVTGQRVDHRSDIFSLGVVLFEMVAGIAPFAGADLGALMYTVVNTPHARPGQLNPQVPDFLALIIDKALAKQPDARYSHASELAADLLACLDSLDNRPPESKPAPAPGEATLTLPGAAGAGGTATLPWPAPPPATAPSRAADASTTPLPGVVRAPPAPLYLPLSRRFDSSRALERLMTPGQAATAPAQPKAFTTLRQWLRSPRHLAVAVMFSLAVAAAVFLVAR